MGSSVSHLVVDERKAIEEAEDNDRTHLTILMRNSKELGRAREQVRKLLESKSYVANPVRSVCFRMASDDSDEDSSSSEEESDEDEDEEEEVQDNPTVDSQENHTCSSNEEHTKDNSQRQGRRDEAPNSDDTQHGGKAQAAEKRKKEEHDDEGDEGKTNANASTPTRHTGVSCDDCGESPIIGTRYNSTTQNDYDVCQKCLDKNYVNDKANFVGFEREEEDSDSEDEEEEEGEEEEEKGEDLREKESDDEEPLLKLLDDQQIFKEILHDLESAPLETIWFDFNDDAVINAGPVVSLIKQTRETLKYVSFMQVHMRQNIEDLEEAFQDHPVLQKVVVLNNDQANIGEISVPARECVIPAVAKCPKLTEVIIEGNSVVGLKDLASSTSLEKLLIRAWLCLSSPECIAIFDGLRRNQNTTLKHLEIVSTCSGSIRGCKENDIQAFNDMLRINNSIQKLWIPVEYNLLPSIAKALESNKKVHFLNLHFIAYKGYHKEEQPLAVQAMLDMVKVNTTLEDLHHLSQDGNPWEVDGMKGKREIHWYLRLNAAGRGKLLNNPGATIEDLLHSIDYVKDCPSSIFFFLQNNLSFIVEALQKDSANSDDERPAKKRKVTAGL